MDIRLVEVGFLALSGVSHLNSLDHVPYYLRDEIEASVLTIQAYHQENLLLEIPMAFAGFAVAQGSKDIVSFLPLNRSLNVKILFHTKEVGWVTIEEQFGPLGYKNDNVSFVMLPMPIAEILLTKTKYLHSNMSGLGYNLDRYTGLLTEAIESLDIARDKFMSADPVFGNNEIDWGEDGNNALFHAEVSIGKSLRFRNLVEKYVSDLQVEPFGTIMVTVALLSLLLSFFLAILLFQKTVFQLGIVIFINFAFFYLNLTLNPILGASLGTDGGQLPLGDIKIPLYFVILAITLAITICFILVFRILSGRQKTFFMIMEFSFRSLKRQKFRSTVFVTTLLIISLSFTLLISVAYKGDVISEGLPRNTSYNGIEIGNVQESIFGFDLAVPQYQRIPEGLTILINASLEIFGLRSSTQMLQRDFLTAAFSQNSDTFQSSNITVTSSANNISIGLKNYFATIPSIEADFSHLDSAILSGAWLPDTQNTSTLGHSAAILPSELAESLQVQVNDTITFQYFSNEIWTNATLDVQGILNTTQMTETIDIDGKSLTPPKFELSERGLVTQENLCDGTEFIIIDFLWWRYARAESYSEEFTFTRISRLGPTKIILNTTNRDLGFDLADRLEGYNIWLATTGIVYNLEFSIIQTVEGLVPQLLPVILAIPIITQTVLNSLLERKREIQLYGTIGMPARSILVMILLEIVILSSVSGILGYLGAISIFPILSQFGFGQYLTQKTGSAYMLLSLVLSIGVSVLATLPFIVKILTEIIPSKPKKGDRMPFQNVLIFSADISSLTEKAQQFNLYTNLVPEVKLSLFAKQHTICVFEYSPQDQYWSVINYDPKYEKILRELERKIHKSKLDLIL
jgi:ABC-type lipoprotein release transport system permease subunit